MLGQSYTFLRSFAMQSESILSTELPQLCIIALDRPCLQPQAWGRVQDVVYTRPCQVVFAAAAAHYFHVRRSTVWYGV